MCNIYFTLERTLLFSIFRLFKSCYYQGIYDIYGLFSFTVNTNSSVNLQLWHLVAKNGRRHIGHCHCNKTVLNSSSVSQSQGEHNWYRVLPSRPKCHQLSPRSIKWDQMGQSRYKCDKLWPSLQNQDRMRLNIVYSNYCRSIIRILIYIVHYQTI